MSTCATCRHWLAVDQQADITDRIGLGKCGIIYQFWDSTKWDETGDNRVFLHDDRHNKAFVQDGSDYWAILLTAPDFGCVLHEGKEE